MKTINIDRFMETIHILTLDNGMSVHLIPKKESAFTTFVELSVPFGALHLTYEIDGVNKTLPAGVAHFLEHKMFAMPEGDAFQVLSQLGADANAMTSYEATSYVFSTTIDVVSALEYLLKMMDTPYFTTENVDAERLIIKEELNMYLDDPNTVIANTLMENMYRVHPVRNDILGSEASLNDMTIDILKDAYDAFYAPSKRLLVIAGAIDLERLLPFLKTYGESHPDSHHHVAKVDFKEPRAVMRKHQQLELGLGISKLLFGFKLAGKPLPADDRIKAELAMSFLVGMLFSPSAVFYQTLTDRGLINQSFSVSNTYEEGLEHVVFAGETSHPVYLKNQILKLLRDTTDHGLDVAIFERFKKAYLGRFIYALDHQESKAYLYGKYIHSGSFLFDVIRIMETVTLEDVKNELSKLNTPHRAVVIAK